MADLAEGVEGFDEDGLNVSRASVVSGCEMHPVLPIQGAGDIVTLYSWNRDISS